MLFLLLPVHNRIDITRRFIESLQAQTYQEFQIVLIDDGSTDGTSAMVQRDFPSVIILRGNGNWWWAGSLHQGYLWLKSHGSPPGTMVLIINDDAVFGPEYLQTAVTRLEKLKRTLLVSNAYGIETQKLIDGGVHADWRHLKFTLEQDQTKINCASTRGLFLFASDFMEIGGFHPHLLPHYTSDYEFTMRAYNKGYTLLVDERLKLYSDESTTGFVDFRNENSYGDFLKRLFSKKYVMNPIYYSNFIAFSCPWPWKVRNWLVIWSSTAWKLVKNAFIFVVFKRPSN